MEKCLFKKMNQKNSQNNMTIFLKIKDIDTFFIYKENAIFADNC